MGSLNSCTLLGRLGKDPETRITTGGKNVCTFSLATDRRGGGEEVTDWHRITCWEKTAEIAAKYLRKGSQVLVQGTIQYSKFQGKDGTEKYSTDITARQITFVDKLEAGSSVPAAAPSQDKAEMPF